MGKIKLLGLQCDRCGHKWRPRGSIDRVEICPKCKSPYWNRPKVRKAYG